MFGYYLFFPNISTSTLLLYVDQKSFLLLVYYKLFLTCLICFISTSLGTNSLNNADVPLSNKQTHVAFAESHRFYFVFISLADE